MLAGDMDSATAALIGASVGATTTLAGQFLANSLSLKRERRSQRRVQLYGVIAEAAQALYEPIGRPPSYEDEPAPHPESLAAKRPHLNDPRIRAFNDSFGRALVLLQIHLGHDHPLIDSYGDAYVKVSTAVERWVLHLEMDESDAISEIPELSGVLRAAQVARDEWMGKARAYVEAV